MKFSIGSKIYDVKDVEQLSLWLLLELQSQTKDTAQPLDVGTVQMMHKTLDDLPNDEARKVHPYAGWVLGVTIWASRRLGGEEITFREAIDFPMRQLTFLPDADDHKKPADPTRRPRPASAGAARKRAAKSTPKTSRSASTRG